MDMYFITSIPLNRHFKRRESKVAESTSTERRCRGEVGESRGRVTHPRAASEGEAYGAEVALVIGLEHSVTL
jgi:hypothetical protein